MKLWQFDIVTELIDGGARSFRSSNMQNTGKYCESANALAVIAERDACIAQLLSDASRREARIAELERMVDECEKMGYTYLFDRWADSEDMDYPPTFGSEPSPDDLAY